MPTRQFLSFTKARDYVRSLNFHSSRDWRAWACTEKRPPFIPAAPSQVYAEEFKTFPDFLGYRSPAACRDMLPLEEVQQKQLRVRKQGMANFHQHLEQHSNDFVFDYFAKESFIGLLLRPKSSENRNENLYAWMPIRTTYLRSDGRMKFTDAHGNFPAYGVFGFEISGYHVFYFPLDRDYPDTISVTKAGRRYQSCEVESAKLDAVLWNHYDQSPRYSLSGWLDKGFLNARDKVWGSCVRQLFALIYEPLKIDLKFDVECIGAGHNVCVDGVPTLHRTAFRSEKNEMLVSLRRSINNRSFSFSMHDTLEFLVVLVPDQLGTLRGVYLFPKQILVEKCILRDIAKQKPGKRRLRAHFPWSARDESQQESWEWQDKFLLDLAKPAQAKKKFLKLFQKHRPLRYKFA